MIDMTGRQAGRLKVLGQAEGRHHGQLLWECQCECGKVVVVSGADLRKGHTKSCGCLQGEVRVTANTKHGQASRSKPMGLVYRVWIEMKQRCYNPKCNRYYTHGGRGIKVCDRWRDSFETFAADMGPRPPGMSLERKNNDGDYEPSNCRWATKKDQARNKRNNRVVCAGGESRCVAQWSDLTGIPAATIRSRLKSGRTNEEAVGMTEKAT